MNKQTLLLPTLLLLLLLVGSTSSTSPSNKTDNSGKNGNNNDHNSNHNDSKNKKDDKDRYKEPDEAKPGRWSVIDEEQENSDRESQRQHKGDDHQDKDRNHPACILAKMRASLVFPVRNADGKVNNRTINVPAKAEAKGKCNENQQWLTLVWKNQLGSGHIAKTGQITFLFEMRGKEYEQVVKLTNLWATIALFLEDDSGKNIISSKVPSQNLIMHAKGEEVEEFWAAPKGFSFTCRSRMELQLNAHTLPLRAEADEYLITEPVEDNKAYLVIDDLQVEAFRSHHHMYSNDFAKRDYDCKGNYSYPCMPAVVACALTVLIAFSFIMFRLRVRLGLLTQREMEANLIKDDNSDEEAEVCHVHGNRAAAADTIPEESEPKEEEEGESNEIVVPSGTLVDIDGEDGHHADASASSSEPEE